MSDPNEGKPSSEGRKISSFGELKAQYLKGAKGVLRPSYTMARQERTAAEMVGLAVELESGMAEMNAKAYRLGELMKAVLEYASIQKIDLEQASTSFTGAAEGSNRDEPHALAASSKQLIEDHGAAMLNSRRIETKIETTVTYIGQVLVATETLPGELVSLMMQLGLNRDEALREVIQGEDIAGDL